MQIHTIDLTYLDRPNTIASYLVQGPENPVLVETGPGSTLESLKKGLADHGLKPADIHHVLVTHIHLDHAGAAGWWAQQGATIYVHRIGARHLIDPSKLIASASRIYGDDMERLWGEIVPAPAERVVSVVDGDLIEVAGLQFTAIDTPGHASHHHVYRLDDVAFTGDASGIHIPGSALIDLPAPPPEFNLELWLQTIERIEKEQFKTIYPTHFGRLDDPARQLTGLAELLRAAAEFIRLRMVEELDRSTIVDRYLEWHLSRARALGMSQVLIDRYEVSNPHFMSVDGIMRYWRKKGLDV